MILLCVLTFAAMADEARPLAANPVTEVQVRRLSEELRCLVCQNQTLADSSAPLAEDLRNEIREMAAKNMSDQEIIDYLVARYGDFVRYRPPLKSSTVLLWLGPFALLAAAGVGLVVFLRRRQGQVADDPLTAEQARQVAELLNKES